MHCFTAHLVIPNAIIFVAASWIRHLDFVRLIVLHKNTIYSTRRVVELLSPHCILSIN